MKISKLKIWQKVILIILTAGLLLALTVIIFFILGTVGGQELKILNPEFNKNILSPVQIEGRIKNIEYDWIDIKIIDENDHELGKITISEKIEGFFFSRNCLRTTEL